MRIAVLDSAYLDFLCISTSLYILFSENKKWRRLPISNVMYSILKWLLISLHMHSAVSSYSLLVLGTFVFSSKAYVVVEYVLVLLETVLL